MNRLTKAKKISNGNFSITISSIFFLAILWTICFYFLLIPTSFKFLSFNITIFLSLLIIAILPKLIGSSSFGTIGPFGRTFIITVVTILYLVGIILYGVFHSPIFRPEEYRNLIGNIEQKQFNSDIEPIDITQIPTINVGGALRIADKILGERGALGSQVVLGEPTMCNQNGRQYWVIPLLHSGFFKWNENKQGTIGYIKMSVNSSRDVKLITDTKLKYQPNAYFGDNLHRHLYYNGYHAVGLEDYSFEIDDNGHPYWVVTKYKNTLGFGGKQVTGVIIVDPSNGAIQEYDLGNIPQWVDRVYPEELIKNQVDLWGKLIHGYWNWSNRDKVMVTNMDKSQILYNKGNCYFYSGITSVGVDESLVGFTLTNSRTKETVFYKVSGATEEAAMKAAEGKVQQYRYRAIFPTLFNIDGHLTYLTPLVDKNGLGKMIAFVNVKSYNTIGIGENIEEAKSDYLRKLYSTGGLHNITSKLKIIRKQVELSRIQAISNRDSLVYYAVTPSLPGKILHIVPSISEELPLTRDGDTVNIGYNDTDKRVVDVLEFDNLNIR